MARTALEWGVRDLAGKARISPSTVARFERGEDAGDVTVAAMQTALERGGVEFIPARGGKGPGVRLAKDTA